MEQVYLKGCGEGYVGVKGEQPQGIEAFEVLLGEQVVKPGDFYQFDFWNRPLKYLGVMKAEQTPEMIFEIGEWDNKSFFEIVCHITPTRVYKMYSDRKSRDYHLVKGVWK